VTVVVLFESFVELFVLVTVVVLSEAMVLDRLLFDATVLSVVELSELSELSVGVIVVVLVSVEVLFEAVVLLLRFPVTVLVVVSLSVVVLEDAPLTLEALVSLSAAATAVTMQRPRPIAETAESKVDFVIVSLSEAAQAAVVRPRTIGTLSATDEPQPRKDIAQRRSRPPPHKLNLTSR